MSIEYTTSRPTRVRFWTPSEANEALIDVIVDIRRAQQLLEQGRGLMASAGRSGEPAHGEVERIQAELQRILDSLGSQGIEIKGFEPALLDFPALRYGLEVYLCWQDGEDSVMWWHPIPTGLAGRQLLAETPDAAWEWCN